MAVIPPGFYARMLNGAMDGAGALRRRRKSTQSRRAKGLQPSHRKRLHGEGVQGAEPILGDDAHIAHLHAPAF